MARSKKQWSELSPLKRIVKLVVLDVGLRVWALADLARRPEDQVNGSKKVWAIALSVVNSAGVLPTIYFIKGRKQLDQR